MQDETWDESVLEFFNKFRREAEVLAEVPMPDVRVSKSKAEYDLLMAEAKAEYDQWVETMKGKWDRDKQKGRDFILRRATLKAQAPGA